MKLGIVGLPNVGKSTLFNAITNAGAQSANYPFCTIEPNVGIVPVPDKRLKVLEEMYSSERVIPAAIEFVDIAGLVRGASKGEGLGNKFLSHIREVDAVVHVVRCFEDDNIVHVDGATDPARDIETIELELIFSDLEMLERRIDKVKKLLKGEKKHQGELEFLEKLVPRLERGIPARGSAENDDELQYLSGVSLLTAKPVMFAANLSEEDFASGYDKNPHYQKVCEIALAQKAGVLPVCAKIEEEIASLDDEEKTLFLSDLGLVQSGLDRLIEEGYRLLGLISYLTAGPKEVRAWTIPRGFKAPQAAGVIHSDFERGFIRAEIIGFDELVSSGSMTGAKEKGLVRSEGKEYVVKDGDVILFRFNV